MPHEQQTAIRFVPRNIVTLDQERGGITAVVNGGEQFDFDPVSDLDQLPAGGGYVVADGNCWSVRNDLSASQYCWESDQARAAFLAELAARGYRALTVANKLANTLFIRYGYTQADAVCALYDYVHDQVSESRGRALPDGATVADFGDLPCGCEAHWSFDSGHPVRATRGDRSHGQRDQVKVAFLRLQNAGGYESGFAADVIDVAWHALDAEGRKLFGLAARSPKLASNGSPNKLMAVAACTHDPATGTLRTHGGVPWGLGFITHRVIGLNGTTRGTGDRAPGNPMRAVLRALGRRNDAWNPRNPAERSAMDRYVRDLIRALQLHPQLRTSAQPAQGQPEAG